MVRQMDCQTYFFPCSDRHMQNNFAEQERENKLDFQPVWRPRTATICGFFAMLLLAEGYLSRRTA